MHPKFKNLLKAFRYISFFYVPLVVATTLFYFSMYYNFNLFVAILIALFGNIFLALFTQVSNYVAETYSVPAIKSRDFIYQNFTDCFFRGLAGLLEIVFYTISFATGLSSLVAGYLLLKTVSIWQDKDNYNNKKEGLHTAILRSAIVISLIVSLAASYYLAKFISK